MVREEQSFVVTPLFEDLYENHYYIEFLYLYIVVAAAKTN